MMKKKLICITLILLLLCNVVYAQGETYNLNISTEACILIDADTGKVIYEKNADKVLYPASITKVMTAILAIEMGDFSKPCIASPEAVNKIGAGASKVGLQPQEEVYLNDLLYMMMLPSGNDAANVIAENVAGGEEDFVRLMNEKAHSLGAISTTFRNPIGLDCGDGFPDHKTTARDFALISRYAMSLEKYRQVVSTTEYKLPVTNKHQSWSTIKTTNRFFTNIAYDKELYLVNGAKTGRTSAAANTLVVSAKNSDNVELICVLLKNSNREQIFLEARQLFDYGFSLIKDQQIEVSSGFYDVRYRDSKDMVNSFHKLGYISGYKDNSFKPLLKATKEEFITVFMRVNGEVLSGPAEYWSKPYLDLGVNKGLIDMNWYSERCASLSQTEAVGVLYNAIEKEFGMEYIYKLQESNAISEDLKMQLLSLANHEMLPEQNENLEVPVTREEMVVLLYQYMKLKKEYQEAVPKETISSSLIINPNAITTLGFSYFSSSFNISSIAFITYSGLSSGTL